MMKDTVGQPLAVVDFVGAANESRRLEFSKPHETIVVDRHDDVVPALRRVEAMTQNGYYGVGFVSYDAAPAFDSAFRIPGRAATPLVWFGLFDAPASTQAERAAVPALAAADWQPHVPRAHYDESVESVRRGIRAGSFYQVNHTLRLRGGLVRPPRETYERLRGAQPRSYGMFLDIGRFSILSVSPELFFSQRGRTITMRPMKGTAARGRSAAEDRAARVRLGAGEKDRAENVMIVDLVRNDLGRLAKLGSVEVPRLFEIERHPTVWQMTSTVSATLRDDVCLSDIFGATFPSGSVVGAPKIAAADFIARHEDAPRGAYCGAMGIVFPGGDCDFNVAIRTLVFDRDTAVAEYGVGGGITIDSTIAGEYDEILTKAAVLRGDSPAFDLFETMRLSDGVVARREGHLRRVCASAEYFDFAHPRRPAEAALDRCTAENKDGDFRVRLVVTRDGSARCELTPVAARDGVLQTMRCALSATPVSSQDRFLFHKTTRRETYESRRRERPDVDEVILFNERGELTECSIGNLVVEIDGERFTPPLDCGLLPGVYREQLIDEGLLEERVLYPSDLERSSAVWLINSLRGWVRLLV